MAETESSVAWIYGSGDVATAELREEFFKRGLDVTFKDIRKTNKRGEHDALIFLSTRNLDTVPQVFNADGSHVGGYAAAMKAIKHVPLIVVEDATA